MLCIISFWTQSLFKERVFLGKKEGRKESDPQLLLPLFCFQSKHDICMREAERSKGNSPLPPSYTVFLLLNIHYFLKQWICLSPFFPPHTMHCTFHCHLVNMLQPMLFVFVHSSHSPKHSQMPSLTLHGSNLMQYIHISVWSAGRIGRYSNRKITNFGAGADNWEATAPI